MLLEKLHDQIDRDTLFFREFLEMRRISRYIFQYRSFVTCSDLPYTNLYKLTDSAFYLLGLCRRDDTVQFLDLGHKSDQSCIRLHQLLDGLPLLDDTRRDDRIGCALHEGCFQNSFFADRKDELHIFFEVRIFADRRIISFV